MTVSQDEMFSAAAAERPLDAQENAVPRPEAEADAVVRFEVLEAEIAEAGCHAAGVVENGAVDSREDLPAILRLQQQHIAIPEAELPEAAEVVRSAQRALVVE